MSWFSNKGRPWRGIDGEDDMTPDDWQERGGRTISSLFAGNVPPQVHDEQGDDTWGCYNGDYTDEEHENANRRLEEDEEFAEETYRNASNLSGFWNWFTGG